MKRDKKSHICGHSHSTTACFDSYNSLYFKIIDKANSKFDIKIEEAIHINWIKPKHTTKPFSSYTFTIACVTHLFFFVSVFLPFLFIFYFSLSLTLIISIFCCFNYTSLLLDLIITDIVHTLYNNYVRNIYSWKFLRFIYTSLFSTIQST